MVSDNVVAFQRNGAKGEAILAPTDGSALSIAAALKAVELARRLAVRLVVFTSIPAYQYPVYLGGIPLSIRPRLTTRRNAGPSPIAIWVW